jgi:probable rRNA maturation factor
LTNNISIQYGLFTNAALHRAALPATAVKLWIGTAVDTSKVQAVELTVRLVSEAEGRELNRSYRGKDYATNVLTFDYTRTPVLAADLVLCAPVVAREAAEQGKTLQAHYAHLVVHGTLHAQGYDHETNTRDANEMEALEVLILGSLGFGNPYAD